MLLLLVRLCLFAAIMLYINKPATMIAATAQWVLIPMLQVSKKGHCSRFEFR